MLVQYVVQRVCATIKAMPPWITSCDQHWCRKVFGNTQNISGAILITDSIQEENDRDKAVDKDTRILNVLQYKVERRGRKDSPS